MLGYGGFPLASACILHAGVGLARFDVIPYLCFMLVELSHTLFSCGALMVGV